MATVKNSDTAILATGSTTLAMGLRALLLSIHPIQYVEHVADLDELLRNLITTRPVLIVIDSSLSDRPLIDALQVARTLTPETHCVIMSDNITELRELVYDRQVTVIIKGTEPGRLARAFENLLNHHAAPEGSEP